MKPRSDSSFVRRVCVKVSFVRPVPTPANREPRARDARGFNSTPQRILVHTNGTKFKERTDIMLEAKLPDVTLLRTFVNRMDPRRRVLQEVDRRTSRAGGVDQLAVLRDSAPLSNSHFVTWQNFEGSQYGIAIV